MNAAARELALLGAAKTREPVLARARQLRASLGMAPSAALAPVLVLGRGDML